MIDSISIENFALIDSTKIDFRGGFTVITGETGSGKSILLNALNLILGERANFNVIGKRGDKSVVEAELNISGFGLEDFFKNNDLDYFETTIVRREIHKQGRSRAFINDTPVQLTVLKALTSQLVHIHSQYNTLDLKDTNYQLEILDVLSGSLKERSDFHAGVTSYRLKQKELAEKKIRLTDSLSQEDYNAFQLNELQVLDLENINYDELQAETKKNENADEIRSALGDVIDCLSEENGVQDNLNQLKSTLARKSALDPFIEQLMTRINSVLIEVEDISSESHVELEKVDFDPRKLDELIAKLDGYNRVLQKHNVSNQEELKSLMLELSNSSQSHQSLGAEIKALESELKLVEARLWDNANNLHKHRLNAIPAIEKQIKDSLNELKLENTILNFNLIKEDSLNAFGCSSLEIMFSPNVGIDPVPVHQAASGGELSRVMLALQSLMSSKIQLHTILFDEIDTGVSGDVAQKMGNTLKKMGEGMQVIAITHLPQVAAKGAQHLKVSKQIVSGITTTFVEELNNDERIEETARLMSGDEISEAALENAKALMQ